METVKITNRTRTKNLEKTKVKLDGILKVVEKHKNCIFWTTPYLACDRRQQEFSDFYRYDMFGDLLEIEISLEVTYSCYYFTKNIVVNGVKKDIRAIRKALAKIEAILEKRGV